MPNLQSPLILEERKKKNKKIKKCKLTRRREGAEGA
jgi:hypothetical protein